jgi:hypothetical protein
LPVDELPFRTRNKQGGIRCQTGKKINKVIKAERVAEAAANSPAAGVRVAVDNMLAVVTVVVADNPVDSVAAVEAVATADA